MVRATVRAHLHKHVTACWMTQVLGAGIIGAPSNERMQLTKHSKVAGDPLAWAPAVSIMRASQLIRGVGRT